MPLKLHSIIKQHVKFTQNTLPPFHPETTGINFQGTGEILRYEFGNLRGYACFAESTSTFSAEPWVDYHQVTKNIDSSGVGISTHNLLPKAPNSPIYPHDAMQQTVLLPLGEMCLQVTVGSGLPVAMQVRLILFPSLMEISEEISTILGDTVETRQNEIKNPPETFLSCLNMVVGRTLQRVKYMDYSKLTIRN